MANASKTRLRYGKRVVPTKAISANLPTAAVAAASIIVIACQQVLLFY
jgi:hypothetical protein